MVCLTVHHCRRIPVHAMACISIPYITHANGSLVFSDSGLQWFSCLTEDRKTSLSVESIKRLLHLCVTTTYVVHMERQILQAEGAATGHPLSPVVDNIYMEHFRHYVALESAKFKPGSIMLMTPCSVSCCMHPCTRGLLYRLVILCILPE